MEMRLDSCDLGLSDGKYGTCGVSLDEPASESSLSPGQSAARAAAGVGFVVLASLLARNRWGRPAGALAAWFGASHLVAAATRFDGCPELGAIPSLLLRRRVATRCGPWSYLDQRLGLTSSPRGAPEPTVAEMSYG